MSLTTRVVTAVAALLVATCDGGLSSPTPTPRPLAVVELKYRVMDELGRPWFCDPDFYPVARADERDLARQRFAEIQQDPVVLAAIVARLNLLATTSYTLDEQLAIYREWKTLRALDLRPVADAWGFAYLARKTGDTGERVDGRVSPRGGVTVLSRTASGPPPCPICLAVGTRIATPRGDIAVERLRAGDVVWTLNETGQRSAAPLIASGRTPVPVTHEVVRLALADGRVVLVSPGHPTADGRRIGDLVAGDAIDGAVIAGVTRAAYRGGATYDVLPSGPTGAYWANGVLLASTLRAP